MTNFGKRHQICPTCGLESTPARSHLVTAMTARTNAQMPIQTSRPITLIKVYEARACSAVPVMPVSCPARLP